MHSSDVGRISETELYLAVEDMKNSATEEKLTEAFDIATNALEALKTSLENQLGEPNEDN